MSIGKRMVKDGVSFALPANLGDLTAAEERLEASCIRQAKAANSGRIPGPGEFTSTLSMTEARGGPLVRLEVTYEWSQRNESEPTPL